MIDLDSLTIKKTRESILKGEFSSRDLVVAYQREIEKNKDQNAYLEIFQDAYDAAKNEDERIKSENKLKSLSGVVFAVKDNILIKDKNVSAGSKIIENYKAVYDADVIKKLRSEGAIFMGRTNMDEFAMGSSTENSAFRVVKNPYDPSRVPGGSSGGSAAAVASSQCLAALGSDTGGSIRQPASFCGVVGLKPTYGSVSRHGLIAMASSLDQIGPIAKTVEDAEIIFNVLKGKSAFDSTSIETPDFSGKKESRAEKKKQVIGIPKEYFQDGIDEDVEETVREVIVNLKFGGFEIKNISLPYSGYALACYYIIMPAEVSANLARFDGVRYGLKKDGDNIFEDYSLTREKGFGGEVKRRIILGTYTLSAGYYDAYYGRAQKVRRLIKKDFENAFREVDAILTPTAPTPAFKIGEKTDDPVKMYLSDIFTVPVNLAGVPALSVPAGFVERERKALPIGVQLIAPWFGEDNLFEIGKTIELFNKKLNN